MELQTKVDIPRPDFVIDYSTRMMMLGSCFTENIGEKFRYFKFDVDVNPCGIVYNPLSAANTLRLLLDGKTFTPEDLILVNGKWASLYHHGDFSSPDQAECLSRINDRLERARRQLAAADTLIITWGTAWVYDHLRSGVTVANCHKLPPQEFKRRRLDIDEIVEEYSQLLVRIREAVPSIRVIFTVSPIRHWKDGAHGNQLSKATLLLAIDALREKFPDVSYFPSYEIVLDELRDYRFYADDMLHVSPFAVNYIWERFKETYLPASLQTLMARIDRINKGVNHRPFDASSEEYRRFARNLLAEMEAITRDAPRADFSRERAALLARLEAK